MLFIRSANFLRGYLFLMLIMGAWYCKAPVRQPAADITYENGTGKARTIRLPDGSSVVMSVHTVIRISKQFNQTERELNLDGEALFTVDGDTGKAFIVHTRNLQIEVLGARTRFRVDAFAKNAGEEADLLEGKLKVIKSYHSDTDNEPETIASGEMVMINRDIDLMEKEKLDSTELTTLKARW